MTAVVGAMVGLKTPLRFRAFEMSFDFFQGFALGFR